jgi:polyphosphate kinase
MGSADLLDRNLDRRVEAMVPVEDHDAQARLAEIIAVLLEDDRRSWQLDASGEWRRVEDVRGQAGTCDAHQELKARALAAATAAAAPHRPRAGVGSLDPRA